ncbi:hypothetical protein JZ785_27000 [Alicyclobacillus curvatus]|nr:hypothetical protein JZ785_27000 [Alicyclobacillus curvatus]
MEELKTYIRKHVFGAETQGTLFNQYRHVNSEYDRKDANLTRQKNLMAYCDQLSDSIDVMFVGIAPGYSGCRFSGVPFASEQTLLGKKKSNFFDPSLYSQSSNGKPRTENSATKVWNSISDCVDSTVLPHIFLWNVVPYHPQGQTALSNRDPEDWETEQYAALCQGIIDILKPKQICAFGEIPHKKLKSMLKRDIQYIPHPSRASYTTLKDAYASIF